MPGFEARVYRSDASSAVGAVAQVERCPTCGADLPRGFRFCGQCGRALAATLAPIPGDVVTIPFIALVGFSTFSSRGAKAEGRAGRRPGRGTQAERGLEKVGGRGWRPPEPAARA